MYECLLLANDCYKKYNLCRLEPVGIVLHSTDPTEKGELSRFIQPVGNQTGKINGVECNSTDLLNALGRNHYNNHWNRTGVEKAVHIMIGKDASGSIEACQTLPFTMPCWGCGSGSNGSYNGCYGGSAKAPLYIQIEMIEDKDATRGHCVALYNKAIEVCAWLVKQFPKIGSNIVSHREAHAKGYATDHGDPEGYWRRARIDYTMNLFRHDVVAQLQSRQYLDVPVDAWYAEAVAAVSSAGIMIGRGERTFCPKEPVTRAELAQVIARMLAK